MSQDRLLLILTFLDAADVAVELSSGGGGGGGGSDVGEIRNAFVHSIDFFLLRPRLLLLLLSLPAFFVVVTSLCHVFPAAAST